MHIFLTGSEIPELQDYDSIQRGQLLRLAIGMLRKSQRVIADTPIYFCIFGGLVGWLGLPWILAVNDIGVDYIPNAILWSTVGSGVGGTIGGIAGKQIVYRKVRP